MADDVFVGDDDHAKMGIEFTGDDGQEMTKDDVVDIADKLREEVLEETAEEIADTAMKLNEVLGGEVEKKDKPKYAPGFIQELRRYDIPGQNKTCSACSRRLPLHMMDGGKADICDDCKS